MFEDDSITPPNLLSIHQRAEHEAQGVAAASKEAFSFNNIIAAETQHMPSY